MASLNKVFLLGNLTRDPEAKTVPSGTKVTTFGLATSRTFTGKGGDKQEDVCFITVLVWGKAAESCAEFLKKGRQILVEGRLQFRTWEKDGIKHSVHEVVADRVQFLSPKRGGGSPSGTPDEHEVPF